MEISELSSEVGMVIPEDLHQLIPAGIGIPTSCSQLSIPAFGEGLVPIFPSEGGSCRSWDSPHGDGVELPFSQELPS